MPTGETPGAGAENTPPKPPDWTSKAVDSLNDAAGQVQASALTLFGVCAYVGAAAIGTNHETLLRDSNVTLPLLEVGVSQRWFYLLAPALVLVLHFNLLLQQYFLARKLCRLPEAARHPGKEDKTPDLFALAGPLQFLVVRRAKDVPWPVKWLLRIVLMIGDVVLPVALLLAMQGRFLPYHPKIGFKLVQVGLVGLDLGVLSYLLPLTLSHNGRWLSWWWRLGEAPWPRRRRVALRLLFVLGLAASAGLSAMLASWQPDPDCSRPAWARLFPPNLELRGKVLSAAPPTESLGEPTAIRLSASGLHLANRDLRCADLTGAYLVAADLSGANLTGAWLGKSILEAANLSGATLTSATFTDAWLTGADLRGASAVGVDLSGAELIAANLGATVLTGAEARTADLLCADLDQAVLAGASFVRARLEAANLFLADTDAADFGEAYLHGAVTPYWRATELRRAHLGGSAALAPTVDNPQLQLRDTRSELTDYRHVDLAELTPESWQELLEHKAGSWGKRRVQVLAGLQQRMPDVYQRCADRIERARGSETRLPERLATVLYEPTTDPAMQGWPDSEAEPLFRQLLHADLLQRACRDGEVQFATALAKRASRPINASNPAQMAELAAAILARQGLQPSCANLEDLPEKLIGDLRYAALDPPRWTAP